MPSHLALRSYSRVTRGHSHTFHQLVLPLRGSISLTIKEHTCRVISGECAVILAHQYHSFTADSEAKFIVADIDELPTNLTQSDCVVFRINEPFFAFLQFVELQLKFQVNSVLEHKIFNTFYELLKEQTLIKQYDARIKKVVEYISEHVAHPFTINEMANIACLSPTQFKKVFKSQTGQTAFQFLNKQRMNKAQALLTHTDLPISLVAEAVGYSNAAAFSRRFSKFFGLSPISLKK